MSINSSASELENLPGLVAAKKVVLRLAREDVGVHGVLLYGVEGVGKRALANFLARSWLCQNPGPQGACGECRPCQGFARNSGVDILEISPKPPSRIIRLHQIVPAKTQAQENVTSLAEFIRTGPLTARHKVIFVSEAHRMNQDAANAMLKMLEEPPPFAKLILMSDSIGLVLPTIRSRCLTIQCETPLVAEETRNALPHPLLRSLDLTPGAAQRITDHQEWYVAMAEHASRLPRRPKGEALKAAEELRSLCESRKDLVDEGSRYAYAEGLRVLGQLLRSQGVDQRWIRGIAETHRRVIGNANAQLSVDALYVEAMAGM